MDTEDRTTDAYERAINALTSDVWLEYKRGIRPFDGYEKHASWLTIDEAGDVIGWDIKRAARLAVDAAYGETV